MGQLRGFLLRFRPGQPLWSFCDSTHHNRVADILENILGYGCRIDKPTDGTPWKIVIDGSSDITVADGVLYDKASFRCTQTSANKVMVYAGTIRHHGLGHWNTVDTEITLGDSEYRWIFVNFYRDTLTNPTIEQQVEEPISDTSTIRIPLSYWRQTSPGSFMLVKTTHKYDVQIGNPLV